MLRTADGDELHGRYGAVITAVEPADFSFAGKMTIDGGTGPFTEASGAAKLAGGYPFAENAGFYTIEGVLRASCGRLAGAFGVEGKTNERSSTHRMTEYPDPALVLRLVEAPAAEPPDSIDGWMVVQISRTARHAVVLLQRHGEDATPHCQFVFEEKDGRWRVRGGSRGSGSSPPDHDSAVVWLSIFTSFGRRPVEVPLRVVGGRARADVRHVVAHTDRGVTFDVAPAPSGWFHVIVEGADAVTITAVDGDGEPVLARDGLPITLRLESLS